MVMSTLRPGSSQASTTLPSTYPTIAARNEAFVKLLPVIRRHARIRLRHLRSAEREEAIEEVVASAFVSFARLFARREGYRVFATPLAEFAVKGYRVGRRVAAGLNRNDVTSHYCCLRRGVTVRSLDRWDVQAQAWQEILIEDRRFPPADTAAARLDFAAWLTTLTRRDRRMATLLATGESTFVVARRFRLTPGRVSQLRRELCVNWHLFVGDQAAGVPLAARSRPYPRRCGPQVHSHR